jgi:hypothetical protein
MGPGPKCGSRNSGFTSSSSWSTSSTLKGITDCPVEDDGGACLAAEELLASARLPGIHVELSGFASCPEVQAQVAESDRRPR